jgi:hypothetical protein
MKKASFYALLVLSLVLLAHAETLACQCREVYDETVEQGTLRRLGESKAVFSGKVIEEHARLVGTTLKVGYVTTTIKVEHWWKGGTSEEIVLVGWRSSCDFAFTLGKEYLVFAHEHEGKLQTHACSRNQNLDEAEAELKALGKGVKPKGTSLLLQN